MTAPSLEYTEANKNIADHVSKIKPTFWKLIGGSRGAVPHRQVHPSLLLPVRFFANSPSEKRAGWGGIRVYHNFIATARYRTVRVEWDGEMGRREWRRYRNGLGGNKKRYGGSGRGGLDGFSGYSNLPCSAGSE